MNLMGKIFTLLIFFMSICFLVVAVMVGASHRNWKAEAAVKKAEADAAVKLVQSAKTNTNEYLKKLSAEQVSRAGQLAQLESQLKMARESFAQKETQLREVTAISQAQLAELEQAQLRLTQQDKEVADLKANNTTLVDDIAMQFNLSRNLDNKNYELENQLRLQKEKESDLIASLAKTKRVLDKNGLRITDLTDGIVPKLDGKVVKVEGGGLFAISLGTDDGLRVGHVLDIYRSGRFIGKGTVVKAESDLSAVRVINDFMVDTVREDDNVTSKF